jgi:hypothetical protein
MKTKNISKFVIDFIQQHKDDEDFIDKWNSNNNLTEFKKLLTKTTKINEKDKNKPKRGKSSYLHFCDDNREKVKSEFPHYNNKEVITELGLRWSLLKKENPDKILQYDEISKKDRDRYKNEMDSYKKDENNEIIEPEEKIKNEKKIKIKLIKEESKEDVVLDKKKSEVNMVKEDIKKDKKIKKDDDIEDGFFNFVFKKKDKYPDLDEDALLKKLKKKWNALTEDKKEKYKH